MLSCYEIMHITVTGFKDKIDYLSYYGWVIVLGIMFS